MLEEETAAPMENAWQLLTEAESKPGFIISTGSDTLDSLMGGGIYSGEITELFGLYSTGKSQLAMSVALQAVLLPTTLEPPQNELGRVWVLDSMCNFSPIRLAEIFENKLSARDRALDPNERLEAGMKVLERVQVFDVHNAFQLLNILSQLQVLLHETYHSIPNSNHAVVPSGFFDQVANLKLVVIDAFGLLLLPLVSIKHKVGRTLLAEITQLMRTIASTYNIAFLVTNHTASPDFGAHNQASDHANQANRAGSSNAQGSDNPSAPGAHPALGKYWTYVPNAQLLLRYPTNSTTSQAGGRQAELRRSSHAPCGPTARANFTISHKGVDEPLGGV